MFDAVHTYCYNSSSSSSAPPLTPYAALAADVQRLKDAGVLDGWAGWSKPLQKQQLQNEQLQRVNEV
jgi:hypothetical protein